MKELIEKCKSLPAGESSQKLDLYGISIPDIIRLATQLERAETALAHYEDESNYHYSEVDDRYLYDVRDSKHPWDIAANYFKEDRG